MTHVTHYTQQKSTTMASKRPGSSGLSDLSQNAPPRKSMQMRTTSSPVEGRILAGFSDEDIENQLRATCLRAERDVWLRLLPNDDDDDSLFFNTGQYWEHMYPCLHKAGFMSKSKVNEKITVDRGRWEIFCLVLGVRMQMGTYRGKHDSQSQYFIAIGNNLRYDSPEEQIKDEYSVPCSLLGDQDIELRRYFRVCAAQIFKDEMQVLQLIVLDNGDNNMVEERRGKIFGDPVDMTLDEELTLDKVDVNDDDDLVEE
jgi:hypothetical protein